MLYYLAFYLRPDISVLNVFTYHTVRAGGAAFTGFLICLIVGPRLIKWLHALKVGQYIKKDHVADLHALHKGKAGTPTMGGTLIIFSTLFTLALWSSLTNRLLWVCVGVMCLMGAVGFLDDYLKLRRKHNDGLSARAKMGGQILTGLLLGLYLVFNPITTAPSYLTDNDVENWTGLVAMLGAQEDVGGETPARQVWTHLSNTTRQQVLAAPLERPIEESLKTQLVKEMNELLDFKGLYDEKVWTGANINGEVHGLVEQGVAALSVREATRLNRLLLEAALPEMITPSPRNLHTQVEVPGFKNWLIPLGPFYILFVIFIIVAISNAVNLTDGLDGLAAGCSVVSLLAYTGIAYVVSRADWTSYLLLIHVPEASELTVFGAALLGTGLGFLWFNAHPAEVFMGDTGSLALGGVLGTMAILTKQELLLPVVAGLFVLEAASVVIQVASFKTTGKRVFRMAPLHHHFELLGWNETKVTVRFWIIAILFALLSMGSLKLR
ncbi:MAG: Phospho-N-acetylmuramoyl-pentapeptide-transferase [Candidatus Hydrogenedentes bacterium]|nr:Phospho-N-acetylmuramoyl-pentapeptide-transferase [Candidatus Hydrogenedentota bacterium]